MWIVFKEGEEYIHFYREGLRPEIVLVVRQKEVGAWKGACGGIKGRIDLVLYNGTRRVCFNCWSNMPHVGITNYLFFTIPNSCKSY